MKFGEKMRVRRTELKLTQAQAAERIGVSRRAYINWEVDNVTPRTRDVYERISEVFGVPIEWLTNDILDYTPISYEGKLNELLTVLIQERDTLNARINKIQALLEEL